MNKIESPAVPYGIRVPGRLAEIDSDGYQIILANIDPNGVGTTEAMLLDLAQRDLIALRYNASSPLHASIGRVSVGVKVLA